MKQWKVTVQLKSGQQQVVISADTQGAAKELAEMQYGKQNVKTIQQKR